MRAIQELSPDCRDVFVLHRFEDMPLDEIAEHLRIDRAMAEARLAEALVQLSRAIDEADARRSSERK
jgi:RNA polymerase sigma-70 factor (ECF subfamily)